MQRFAKESLFLSLVILAEIFGLAFSFSARYSLSLPAPESVLQDTANIALVATLAFLTYQTWIARRERRYTTYQNLMTRLSDAYDFLADNPQQAKRFYLANYPAKKWNPKSKSEWSIYAFFDNLMGLLESVWVAEKEMNFASNSNKDWEAWRNVLKTFANNPVAKEVCEDNLASGQFDDLFTREIKEIFKIP